MRRLEIVALGAFVIRDYLQGCSDPTLVVGQDDNEVGRLSERSGQADQEEQERGDRRFEHKLEGNRKICFHRLGAASEHGRTYSSGKLIIKS